MGCRKQVLDDDDRELMRYKEMYLPDGDLHSEGAGRHRRFQWKNMGTHFHSVVVAQKVQEWGFVYPARFPGSFWVLLYCVKSLEIDFSIKGLLSPLIQPFLFVRGSFPLLSVLLKSFCEQQYFANGQLYFCCSAVNRDVTA